jgi:hypothetical protein
MAGGEYSYKRKCFLLVNNLSKLFSLSPKLAFGFCLLHNSPVSPQVDAADPQVVSGPDEAWLDLQCSCVGLYSFLTAVSICQGRPKTVP